MSSTHIPVPRADLMMAIDDLRLNGYTYSADLLKKAFYAAPVSAEPVGYVSKQAIERFQAGRHADIYPSIEELVHEFFDATPMALYAAPVAAQAQPMLDGDIVDSQKRILDAAFHWAECRDIGPSPAKTAWRALELRVQNELNYTWSIAKDDAQAQPLPDSLIPTAPDLEYLRGATENTALPAFLRGQIAAAVKKLASRSSGNPGELPELPDIAPTDDWDAVLDDIRRYGDACYRAALAQQDADKVDADPLQGAAEWLLTVVHDCQALDLQRRLLIGYNRANRLLEAARKETQL